MMATTLMMAATAMVAGNDDMFSITSNKYTSTQ